MGFTLTLYLHCTHHTHVHCFALKVSADTSLSMIHATDVTLDTFLGCGVFPKFSHQNLHNLFHSSNEKRQVICSH